MIDTRSNVRRYAKRMGVLIDREYKLNGRYVQPFAENDELNTVGALGHGFVHYRYRNGKVRFAGVCWFAEHAELVKKNVV
jgi:hypothetical protein